MQLAKKMGKDFFLLSENNQARLIGCAWGTWSKTACFQEARKKKDKLGLPVQHKKGTGSPPVVSFTTNLERVTGEGGPDEELERLIAEHEADKEPSPLDDSRPRKVYCRKRL
jgi:hypothetical protein